MAERPEPFKPEWLNEPLVIEGTKIAELVGNPRTAKGKYIRLFVTPDSPRNGATVQDFIAEVSNLSVHQVGELTAEQINELFTQIAEAINADAVDPTTEAPSGSDNPTDDTSNEPSKATESE